MGILYRLGQLWHNVTAQPLSRPELEEIEDRLNPGELGLFERMSDSDQRHAYRVYTSLKTRGQVDPDLLAAALLHDVGKIKCKLSIWDRSVAVIGERVAPQKVDRWGGVDGARWKRSFVIRKHHPDWGARLAAQAGSRPAVVDLIRRHQDSSQDAENPTDELLALLQWADNQN